MLHDIIYKYMLFKLCLLSANEQSMSVYLDDELSK